jgi:hypothetical protein
MFSLNQFHIFLKTGRASSSHLSFIAVRIFSIHPSPSPFSAAMILKQKRKIKEKIKKIKINFLMV